jgi:hypothetical protein
MRQIYLYNLNKLEVNLKLEKQNFHKGNIQKKRGRGTRKICKGYNSIIFFYNYLSLTF